MATCRATCSRKATSSFVKARADRFSAASTPTTPLLPISGRSQPEIKPSAITRSWKTRPMLLPKLSGSSRTSSKWLKCCVLPVQKALPQIEPGIGMIVPSHREPRASGLYNVVTRNSLAFSVGQEQGTEIAVRYAEQTLGENLNQATKVELRGHAVRSLQK